MRHRYLAETKNDLNDICYEGKKKKTSFHFGGPGFDFTLDVSQQSVRVPKSKEQMYKIQLKKFNKRAFSTPAFEFSMRNLCRSAIRQNLLPLTLKLESFVTKDRIQFFVVNHR